MCYVDGGQIAENRKSQEEKSRLHTSEKKGLKAFEEGFDMIKKIYLEKSGVLLGTWID